MINGKRLVVVMPAYKAVLTIEKTIHDILPGVVDECLLDDDASPDDRAAVAGTLDVPVVGIGEISRPTKYFPEASSIHFKRSAQYGFGVLATAIDFRLNHWTLSASMLCSDTGKRLEP